MNDKTDNSLDACTRCGDAIETSEWHPATAVNHGYTSEIHTFCSCDCRSHWADPPTTG